MKQLLQAAFGAEPPPQGVERATWPRSFETI
jgi:hypothetical protein